MRDTGELKPSVREKGVLPANEYDRWAAPEGVPHRSSGGGNGFWGGWHIKNKNARNPCHVKKGSMRGTLTHFKKEEYKRPTIATCACYLHKRIRKCSKGNLRSQTDRGLSRRAGRVMSIGKEDIYVEEKSTQTLREEFTFQRPAGKRRFTWGGNELDP